MAQPKASKPPRDKIEVEPGADKRLANILKNALNTPPQPDVGPTLRKYSAPLLESKVGQLASFNIDLQARLLEARALLSMFNEEVDQARYYFEMTFSSGISEGNYNRAIMNLNGCYRSGAAAKGSRTRLETSFGKLINLAV